MSTSKSPRADSVGWDETTASSSTEPVVNSGNNVQVGVRIRPSIYTEEGTEAAFKSADSQVLQTNRNGGTAATWPFDHVFGSECSTKDIYAAMAKGIVEASLSGYNGVVFAYGQTASGKTFTLFGNEQHPGLVPLSIQDLARLIAASQKVEYLVKLSYIELYNESISDLLQPERTNLNIQDRNNVPFIVGLSEEVVTDWRRVTELLQQGEANRHFASTQMNDRSSRSHVLVRFAIETRTLQVPTETPLRASWGKDQPTHSSSLHLVDLAGSERQSRTGAEGARLKEGSSINKSLLTLGKVIAGLSSGVKDVHVPYRESKLTRLLSAALGGNAKTAMITCISPADSNVEESISTLRFASRAKRVVNKARKNALDKEAAALEQYRSEIEKLRSELSRVRSQEAQESSQTAKAQIEKFQQAYHLSEKLSRAMRRAGKIEESKKVKQELKAVMNGMLDADVMFEESTGLIQQLPAKLRDRLTQQLSARYGPADDTTHATSNADTLEDGVDDGASDVSSWSSAYSDDELLQARESLEAAWLAWEDLRCRHVRLDQAYIKQQRTLEASVRERNRLSDQLTSMQDKLESLQMEIETLNRKLSNQDQQFEDTQRSAQSLQSTLQIQLEEERNSRTEMQNENDQLRQEIMDSATDCERLEHELANLRNDFEQATKRHKMAEDDATRNRYILQGQIENLRKGIATLTEQDGEKTAYLSANLRETQEENMRLQAAVSEFKTKSDQQAEFLARLQSHNTMLIAQAQQSQVQSQKFRQVVEATKQKLTTTNMELTKQQTRTKLLGADLDDALRKLNAVTQYSQEDLQERNERIKQLEETLAKLRADHITIVEELQQRLQLGEEKSAEAGVRWEQERGRLKAALNDAEKRLEKALEAEKDYRAQVGRMELNNKELVASLTRERDELRRKLEESEALLNDLVDFNQIAFQQLMQPTEPVTPRISLMTSFDGSMEMKATEVQRTPSHRRTSSTASVSSIVEHATDHRQQELNKYLAEFHGFYDELDEVAISSLKLAHDISNGQHQALNQLFLAASKRLDKQITTNSKLLGARISQSAAETDIIISQQSASIQKLQLEFSAQLDQNLQLRTEVERCNEAVQQKQMQLARYSQNTDHLQAEIVALERNLAAASATTDQERKNAANWKSLCSQYKLELNASNEKCMQNLTETESLRRQLSTITTEKRRLAAQLESLQDREELIAQVSSPAPQAGDDDVSTTSSPLRRPSALYGGNASFIPSSPFIAKTHCEGTSSDPSTKNSLEGARALLLEDRLRLANEELRLHRQSAVRQSQTSLDSTYSPSRFSTSVYFTPSPIKRLANG